MNTTNKKSSKILVAIGFIATLFGASKLFKSSNECPLCEQPKCHCEMKAS